MNIKNNRLACFDDAVVGACKHNVIEFEILKKVALFRLLETWLAAYFVLFGEDSRCHHGELIGVVHLQDRPFVSLYICLGVS